MVTRVDSVLEGVNEVIVNNLDAYCLSEKEKKQLKYPEGLRRLEYLADENKYDARLFLNIPTELLSSATSLLIFKKPLSKLSMVYLLSFAKSNRLIYLFLVSCIPWKKARISGLYIQIGKSIAAKNRLLNLFIRYIYSKIK